MISSRGTSPRCASAALLGGKLLQSESRFKLFSGLETDGANWLRVYRGMQVNYHVGLVLGIAGTMLLSNAFYSKN